MFEVKNGFNETKLYIAVVGLLVRELEMDMNKLSTAGPLPKSIILVQAEKDVTVSQTATVWSPLK